MLTMVGVSLSELETDRVWFETILYFKRKVFHSLYLGSRINRNKGDHRLTSHGGHEHLEWERSNQVVELLLR